MSLQRNAGTEAGATTRRYRKTRCRWRESDLERCKAARCRIEEKIAEVPYIDKLLDIKGVGMKIIVGFVAEIGDIRRFIDPKQIQKLAGYAIVSNESGKHKGESYISNRGRKRFRYVMYEAAVSVVSQQEIQIDSSILYSEGQESIEKDAVDGSSVM